MENKNKFPPTRYQGSKFKLLKNIKPILEDIKFNSALDAFSGTVENFHNNRNNLIII